MKKFETVIGLEVHAQLSTNSKIFATSSTLSGKAPNTLIDPVTLGLPGCLPVLNRRVVDFAIKLGIAVNCKIQRESIFARKHYFYPDLPKGYQISQYDKPICLGGAVKYRLNGENKVLNLTRIHLEEDAGKNIHLEHEPYSIVDLNRAGVPLVEIVSEPELRSGEEAAAYLKELRQIVRYLDICDGNMEEGSLRCDANVSVRPVGETKLGTKVEIKNLNSFKFIEKAIEFEVARQIEDITSGKEIIQETRLWDENKNVTKAMRSKEHAQDYRYFPDPDLLPLIVDQDWIDKIKSTMPELPEAAYNRFKTMYKLDDHQAELLSEERLVAEYFDKAIAVHNNPQSLSNWICTELFGRFNKEGITILDCPISPENLGELVKLIDQGVISGKIAKTVFEEMFLNSTSPKDIIEAKGLKQVSDTGQVSAIIDQVIVKFPDQVAEYKAGKDRVVGFLVGEIMKASQGKANPKVVNEILLEKLKNS